MCWLWPGVLTLVLGQSARESPVRPHCAPARRSRASARTRRPRPAPAHEERGRQQDRGKDVGIIAASKPEAGCSPGESPISGRAAAPAMQKGLEPTLSLERSAVRAIRASEKAIRFGRETAVQKRQVHTPASPVEGNMVLFGIGRADCRSGDDIDEMPHDEVEARPLISRP